MRHRPSRAPRPAETYDPSQGRGDCLARFVIDRRSFQIVLRPGTRRAGGSEVTRFRLGEATVAVLEDCAPDIPATGTQETISELSARELQVALMVAQGVATKNIAYMLRISQWTVDSYVRSLFAKLRVETRAAMVHRCASLLEIGSSAGQDGSKLPFDRERLTKQ